MRIFCKLGRHRALPDTIWNAGHFFGRCAGCGRDLVRDHGSDWQTVPKGHAIVWKPRTERDIRWDSYRDTPLSPAARAELRGWVSSNRVPIEIRLN